MTATDNISLRALEPEDLDMLYCIENDRQLWAVGATNVPYSRYVLHDYIANSSGDIYTDRQLRLMIVNGEGRAVGIADLINFDPKHLRAEVGIVIAQPFRHQGYGRQALRRLACYALGVLHLHQLYAIVDASNELSLNMFLGVAFTPLTRLPQWLYDGREYRDALLLQKIL
jgi:diamine N-acetyltransferase